MNFLDFTRTSYKYFFTSDPGRLKVYSSRLSLGVHICRYSRRICPSKAPDNGKPVADRYVHPPKFTHRNTTLVVYKELPCLAVVTHSGYFVYIHQCTTRKPSLFPALGSPTAQRRLIRRTSCRELNRSRQWHLGMHEGAGLDYHRLGANSRER